MIRRTHGRTGRRLALGIAALVLIAPLVGCGEERHYPRATPDELVRTTVDMVKQGDARLLPELIHADSERMRRFLDRFGVLMGNLQGLGEVTSRKFPDEIEALRARALEAADDPGGAGLFEAFAGAGELIRSDPGLAFQRTLGQILTDPYGWIEVTEGRLSTIEENDELARVLLDDRDVFPGGVVSLRKVDGQWCYQLPTHLPPLSMVMPRSDEMWTILDHMVGVLNNTVVDLIEDAQAGRLSSLDAIGRSAQDKTAVPLVMVGAAYARQMEAWQRFDRLKGDYRDRTRKFVVSLRLAHKGERAREASKVLTDVLDAEGEARLFDIAWSPRDKRRRFRFKDIPDDEFRQILVEWLAEDGLTLELDPDRFTWTGIEQRINAWRPTEKGVERLGPLPGTPAAPAAK